MAADFDWLLLILPVVGVFAGFVNVMAGGGSLLTLPLLVLLGVDGPVANGTNRVAILVQSLAATAGFRGSGVYERGMALRLSLLPLPGAVLGAWLGTELRGVWFNRVLAILMLALLVAMELERRRRKKDDSAKTSRGLPARLPQPLKLGPVHHLLMVGVGFHGGFVQAGIGFLIMAVLHYGLRFDLVQTNAYKVIIVACFTALALAIFAFRGYVWWSGGLLLALGNATGGFLAAKLALRRGERIVRPLLAIALVLMSIKLLFSL